MSQKSEMKNNPSGVPLGSITWLLHYSGSCDKALMVAAGIGGLLAGAMLPISIVVFGHLIDDFTHHSVSGQLAISGNINRNVLYMVYLFLGKFTSGYFAAFVFRTVGIRISAAVRNAYIVAILAQPVTAIDQLSAGSSLECLGRTSDTIQNGCSEKLGSLFQSVSLITVGLTVALIYCWRLALIMTSGIVIIILAILTFMRFWGPLEAQLNHANAQAGAFAGEMVRNIRTVKALAAEGQAIKQYKRWLEKALCIGTKMTPWAAMKTGIVFFALQGSLAVGLWLGIRLYVEGLIARPSSVFIVFSNMMLITGQLGSLMEPLQGIAQAAVASAALSQTIDAPRVPKDGLRPMTDLTRSDIHFDHVHFAYPGRPHYPVLQDLHFSIKGGQITALVGPSGCGKSTIVALLERWYQVPHTPAEVMTRSSSENRGAIRFHDDDITSLDLKWWRSRIGLVEQEPLLLSDTISANVALGLVGSPWEDESDDVKQRMVREACHMALADEFIDRLPEGYETHVGDQGIKLSGGQRQRLAIARAVIRKAKILILDEATSAIDLRSEQLIIDRLFQQTRTGCTILIVTHRLPTVRQADCIVVLQDGRVAEIGNHEQLVAYRGQYASMIDEQHLLLTHHRTVSPHIREARLATDRIQEQMCLEAAEISHWPRFRRFVNGLRRSDNHRVRPRRTGFCGSLRSTVWQQHRRFGRTYLAILFAAGGCGAAFALQPYLLSHYLAVFEQPRSPRMEVLGSHWSYALLALAVALLMFYGVLAASVNLLAIRVATNVSAAYFALVVRKDISWFDDEHRSSGTLIAQLITDPRQIQQFILTNIGLPLVSVLGVLGCLLLAFSHGWKMSLVVAAIASPIILCASVVRMQHELMFAEYNSRVFLQSSKLATEMLSAFRTVTSLTIEEVCASRYKNLLNDHMEQAVRRARTSCAVYSLSDSIDILCTAFAAWYGGKLLAQGEYGALQFYVVYYSLVQGGQAAGQFLAFSNSTGNAIEAAARIMGIENTSEGNIARQEDERALMRSIPDDSHILHSRAGGVSIQFKDVTFKYSSRETPVHASLSLFIGPGEYVGITGPSGCGKTTILLLLSGLYSLAEGNILVDGRDMHSFSKRVYHGIVSLVSQEPTLFPGSIRENLMFGLPEEHALRQGELEDACQMAGIHDYISSLPGGYDTQLGTASHCSLSGGQKQKLCIARAILRRPRVLLLDEVTSNLDNDSEMAVQRLINTLSARRKITVVAVTHRLPLLRNADRILVLERDAAIVEDGTHESLLSQRGSYWRMCLAQKTGNPCSSSATKT